MTSSGQQLLPRTLRALGWALASRIGAKLAVLVSTMVLARLLLQSDFGVFGYALILIGLLDILRSLGLQAALIYLPTSEHASSSAFYLGIAIATTLAVLVWLVAPLLHYWIDDARIVELTRLLALALPISAAGAVHDALLQKQLDFKRRLLPEVSGSVVKASAAVILASLGFSVWSLVIAHLAGVVTTTALNWRVLSWRPLPPWCMTFSAHLTGLWNHLHYGLHISAINLLTYLLATAGHLSAGYFYGAAALGLYLLAYRLPELLIKQLSSVLSSVLFPALATLRADPVALKSSTVAGIRYTAAVTLPLATFMSVLAEPLVAVVLSTAWLAAAPLLQILTLHSAVHALVAPGGDALKAAGRADVVAGISAIRLLCLVPGLLICGMTGAPLLTLVWVYSGVTLLSAAVVSAALWRLLALSPLQLLKSLAPIFLAAAMTGTALLLLGSWEVVQNLAPLVHLAIALPLAASVYLASLRWFDRELLSVAVASLRQARFDHQKPPATNR